MRAEKGLPAKDKYQKKGATTSATPPPTVTKIRIGNVAI